MIDTNQSENLPKFCFEVVHKLKPQFLKDVPFLMTMVTQIVEDMEQATNDLKFNEVDVDRLILLIR